MTLIAQNISKSLGGQPILRHADVSIPPGQITAILGPNGAGKTTLLRLLSGDLSPDQGQVKIDGRDIAQLSPKQLAQRRAVLPQNSRTAFGFHAWELIGLGRAPFNDSKETIIAKSKAALAQVDALHLANREVDSLSGGERQRIYLAKALCQIMGNQDATTPYLLLDEPSAALDLKQTSTLMGLLRQTAESGVGIAMIIHDVRVAQCYADRCALVQDRGIETVMSSDLSAARIARLFDIHPQDVRTILPEQMTSQNILHSDPANINVTKTSCRTL